MIAKLKGIIDKKLVNSIILDTGAVGYQIFVPATILQNSKQSDKITLWTHPVVRENEIVLYGFLIYEELKMFEALLSISGVGPKMALGVLSQAKLPEIEKAIDSINPSFFTKIPGIGKKNANRIILELKSKLEKDAQLDLKKLQAQTVDPDALSALKNLGLKDSEAREILQQVDSTLSTEEKIKEALRFLDSHAK